MINMLRDEKPGLAPGRRCFGRPPVRRERLAVLPDRVTHGAAETDPVGPGREVERSIEPVDAKEVAMRLSA